jgi:hypothetical protein
MRFVQDASGLLVPRERRPILPRNVRGPLSAASQQALLMGGGTSISDIVHLMFNGANGGSVFTDDGTAASTWTRSDANVTTSTTNPKEGSAALDINAATSYLSTNYTGSNTITTGDYFCGLWFYPTAVGINQAVFGVTDATNTAAGTAFIMYVLTDNRFRLYYSNGTTLSNVVVNSVAITANTWFYFSFYHQSSDNVVYVQTNGGSSTTISGLTTLNVPSGKELRFGKVPSDNGPSHGQWDMCQMRRSIPAGIPGGGASFTPPTTPFS